MASILFHPIVAVQPDTGELVRGADGQIFAESDTSFSSPLPIYDALGTPIERVTVGPNGLTQSFRVDNLDRVVWRSGPYAIPIWSPQGLTAEAARVGAAAADSATAAQAAATAAENAATSAANGGGGGTPNWDSVQNKPTTFAPSDHTHPVAQISDASPVGAAVLKATDKASARAALGAGTGNGTSDLALGTTASTAAPGNHTHTASSLGLGLQIKVVRTAAQGVPATAADFDAAGIAIGDLFLVDPA